MYHVFGDEESQVLDMQSDPTFGDSHLPGLVSFVSWLLWGGIFHSSSLQIQPGTPRQGANGVHKAVAAHVSRLDLL